MDTTQRIVDMAAFRTWLAQAKTPVAVTDATGVKLGSYRLTHISARGVQTWTARRVAHVGDDLRIAEQFRSAQAAANFLRKVA